MKHRVATFRHDGFVKTTMLSKLPRWIWVGMWVLAFVAGMVNVVGILGFEHIPVSHFTGNTSNLGISLTDANGGREYRLVAIIGSFLLGSILSGYVIKDSTLSLGRRYGVALFIECLMLTAAVPFLHHLNPIGLYLLAAACGLQNAMASTYSGSIIRTTHVTGMFTDLGIFLGQRLGGIPADIRRFKLCVIILTGFLLGGVAGTAAFNHFQYDAIYLPAAITGAAAMAYSAYRIRKRNQARALV
jgi:uncharacterized membrane protein YoaK (UPF0700 family)